MEGEKIEKLIKESGKTQQQIADACGVHQTLVSQWCKGKTNPSVKTLIKLAAVLNVTTDEILK